MPRKPPKRPSKRDQRRSFLLHAIVALAAVSVIGPVMILEKGERPTAAVNASIKESVVIAVEHDSPLTLSIASTAKTDPGIIEFWHAGEETIFLSVPEQWTLREVRFSTLDVIQPDPAQNGFRRFRFPSGAVLSFSGTSPDHLLVHNPATSPVHVRFKRILLEEERVQEGSVLVGGKPGRIW